mmetsp:Transcript_5247/g.9022  ORF Transcript_5247/g.9022 Transcript_5247/m.9022 type:complete len:215 (-) Transcript_5247:1260-1904(-)
MSSSGVSSHTLDFAILSQKVAIFSRSSFRCTEDMERSESSCTAFRARAVTISNCSGFGNMPSPALSASMHFKSSAQKATTKGTMDGHEAEYLWSFSKDQAWAFNPAAQILSVKTGSCPFSPSSLSMRLPAKAHCSCSNRASSFWSDFSISDTVSSFCSRFAKDFSRQLSFAAHCKECINESYLYPKLMEPTVVPFSSCLKGHHLWDNAPSISLW